VLIKRACEGGDGPASGTVKLRESYICANECSLFLCRPTAIRPASTSKLPIAISPIANGIIDAPNERQPRALDAPLQRLEKCDLEKVASPAGGSIDLRLFDKILSTIERNS
jgi:hypothetical protein